VWFGSGVLDDASAEVTWNAAVGLARMRNAAGSDILRKMMDRNYLAGFPQMSEQNKENSLMSAIQASTKLADPALRSQVQKLSTSDPSPRVRDAAIKALQH